MSCNIFYYTRPFILLKSLCKIRIILRKICYFGAQNPLPAPFFPPLPPAGPDFSSAGASGKGRLPGFGGAEEKSPKPPCFFAFPIANCGANVVF